MTLQPGWFMPVANTIQIPILKRASTLMAIADTDPDLASVRLLIATAARFVPNEHVEENRCINSVYNDRTIVELSVFSLFQLDYYLLAKKNRNRDDKMRKIIQYCADFFGRFVAGSDYDKLLYSRIQLYGEMAFHNKNFMTDTLKLLKEIILDTQKNGNHRIALAFPYMDDFHLASRLDYHLRLYFERHQNSLLDIYRTIKNNVQG